MKVNQVNCVFCRVESSISKQKTQAFLEPGFESVIGQFCLVMTQQYTSIAAERPFDQRSNSNRKKNGWQDLFPATVQWFLDSLKSFTE